MERIKEPFVANMFYPGETEYLQNIINSFNQEMVYEYKTRAVIVPHAGLLYSGNLAFQGINQLKKDIKNIFIFAPAHKVGFEGLALSGFDAWKTPLGTIPVNKEINELLEQKYNAKIFDEAHENEHSVEIQLPIIQQFYNEVKIIPVLIGRQNPQIITDIITEFYKDESCGFIISSDLSHFLNNENAQITDNKTAQMIETGNINGFRYEQACGATGIFGLTEFANNNNFTLIRINMLNSSAITGDNSRVVGYGAWMLYEGSKNQFIKEYYSDYILTLCKNVISSVLNKETIYTNHKSVFNQDGACFVTLKKHEALRGCIGSIVAHQPLINDLVQHAQDAAFNDPRFNPVDISELNDLTINVSLLSEPKPISFKDENDLMSKIVPYKDGIIIRDGQYQSVFLPSVWEELPDKEHFMKALKIKAGMQPDYFSKTFEAYRFYTEYIENI